MRDSGLGIQILRFAGFGFGRAFLGKLALLFREDVFVFIVFMVTRDWLVKSLAPIERPV